MLRAKYVDPIIGTVGDEQQESFHGGGKTHPGACFPGGLVQLSPDTVTGGDNGTGYNFCHNTIEGFSFNHLSGIGWYGDLGNLQIMPVVGDTDLRSGSNEEVTFLKGKKGWKSEFSHEAEKCEAGYYAVNLDRYGIFAEATVSEHTGVLRLTYPEKSDARVIFNFSRRIAGKADFQKIKIKDNKIEGEIICTPAGGGFGRGVGKVSYTLYFYLELSVLPKVVRFFSGEEYIENVSEFEGEDVGASVEFYNITEPVVIKCGISYVDLEGAKNNFNAECKDYSFDEIRQSTFEAWEKEFSSIEVESKDETDLTLFYTCLYHTLLDPRTFSDFDGRFKLCDTVFKNEEYTHRTVFSGWDVYRSEFPLLTVIRPDMVNDEISSLLKIAELKNSSFPRWELMGNDSGCMVGNPGLIITGDAYIKGIKNFDVKKAYEIFYASCMAEDTLNGKPFLSLHPKTCEYKNEAYVAESLSDTLEFLLADFVMYKLSKELGEEKRAEYFEKRIKKYSDNFNKETGFMQPRNKNGEFLPIKDEYDTTGCVESNIYQQSWFVPYDVKGLYELFGKERSVELLERLFEKADFKALWNENYNHSNEPCHNLTHYFNLMGIPNRTQYWTRRVQKEAYRLGAFGFCGNEDVGQISAWFVLSALGFAQICPGKPEYFINTPLFKSAKIKLDKNYHSCKTDDCFIIKCDKDPLEYPYIKEIYLNGEKVLRPYILYSEITSGGVLEFILTQ